MDSALPQTGPLRLSISLVCYHSDNALLQRTLTSLQNALQAIAPTHSIAAKLIVIDNGHDQARLRHLLDATGWQQATLISNEENSGFGRANNQAILSADSDFHLVLNPDVELASDAMAQGLDYLQQHTNVVALSPACHNSRGEVESLCKRYPPLVVLLLRGFAPRWLKQRCQQWLDDYECKDLLSKKLPVTVDLISGCFMLCRTDALQQVGGFDDRYFLYFEDFALSKALASVGELKHVPACRIVHHGGNAARKGLRHILLFMGSAVRFYNHYGWKLW